MLRSSAPLTACARPLRVGAASSSGVKGVTRDSANNEWRAALRAGSKPKSRSFSIAKYGEEGAKQRAVQAVEASHGCAQRPARAGFV